MKSTSTTAPTAPGNIKNVAAASQNQLSQGLVLQGYCNSVLQQSLVDFSADTNLLDLQNEINNGLTTAKKHANNYLNTISPNILAALSDLNNYATIYSSVPATLPEGSTVEQWTQALGAIKQVSENNLRNSKLVLNSLQTLNGQLTADTAAFAQIVYNLNQVMKGDNGVLDSIATELGSIDSQVAAAIVGAVFGGLAVAGGVFMIVVGAVAEFVTVGTSTELVIGGVLTTVAGIGSTAAAIISIVDLYKKKAALLTEQSLLNAEVNLVAGVTSAYNQLSAQVSDATDAAEAMQTAWSSLNVDLSTMISDLQNGILTTGELRTMFLQQTNADIKTLITDIQVIKEQMAGVKSVVLPEGETLISQLAALASSQSSN